MFVKYIFYRQSDDKSDNRSDNSLKITTYVKMVTDYLKEHKEINISKTIKLLNLSKSRSNEVLKTMQKSGIIIREGSARATKYVLNKKITIDEED